MRDCVLRDFFLRFRACVTVLRDFFFSFRLRMAICRWFFRGGGPAMRDCAEGLFLRLRDFF